MNHGCRHAVALYRERLTRRKDEPSFIEWHLEAVVEALKGANAGAWVDEFYTRYLDFDARRRLGVAN